MEKEIEQHLPQIQQLMRRYGVQRAYLFGSAARGTMKEDSDVDFIIKFPDDMHYTTYADNYFALAEALEALLQKNVDLTAEETIKNPYLIESINRNRVPLL